MGTEKEKKNFVKQKYLIIFLDEGDKEKQVYAELLEKTNFTITFKTSENIITIPLSRLIKIKEKIEDDTHN